MRSQTRSESILTGFKNILQPRSPSSVTNIVSRSNQLSSWFSRHCKQQFKSKKGEKETIKPALRIAGNGQCPVIEYEVSQDTETCCQKWIMVAWIGDDLVQTLCHTSPTVPALLQVMAIIPFSSAVHTDSLTGATHANRKGVFCSFLAGCYSTTLSNYRPRACISIWNLPLLPLYISCGYMQNINTAIIIACTWVQMSMCMLKVLLAVTVWDICFYPKGPLWYTFSLSMSNKCMVNS